MYDADRRTHLKIVVVGLFCATLVAVVGLFAHVSQSNNGLVPIVKAGQPTTMSGFPRFNNRIVQVFGVCAGDAGKDSTARPVNKTGPVGAPVGDPPLGSNETAKFAVRSVLMS